MPGMETGWEEAVTLDQLSNGRLDLTIFNSGLPSLRACLETLSIAGCGHVFTRGMGDIAVTWRVQPGRNEVVTPSAGV